MADLFLVLFFLSLIGLIAGLAKPSIFTRITKKEMTRKKIGLVFGVALLAFVILTGATHKPKEKIAQPQPEKTITTITPVEEIKPTPEVIIPDIETPEPMPAPKTIIPVEETEPTPAPETKTQRDTMIEIFKANALKKWGDDYAMVNYEVKKQTEAYDWVIKYAKYSAILEKAKQEWDNDYAMVKYEYEKQAEAYGWINQQTAYLEIMAKAKQKWGDDYAMVKWEYEKQVEAYEAL